MKLSWYGRGIVGLYPVGTVRFFRYSLVQKFLVAIRFDKDRSCDYQEGLLSGVIEECRPMDTIPAN